MKHAVVVLFMFLFTCMPLSHAQKKQALPVLPPRYQKVINTDWAFNYFPGEKAENGYESPEFDDSKWPAVSIPHTWSTYETTGEIHPFIRSTAGTDNLYWWKGWGWYRKHFTVNTIAAGKKVFVEFEGVRKYCKVWINGKYLGNHKGSLGSFDFDITGYITPGKDNLLAVAVSNTQNDKFGLLNVVADNLDLYSGIFRDVTLVVKDDVYIPMQGSASHEGGTFITTLSVSEKEAVVRIQTWVQNDYNEPKECILNSYITDASGRNVQVIKSKAVINPKQLYKFDQISKPVSNPHLWSPDDPYLYEVRSEVLTGGKITDVFRSPLGLRWFRWDYNENNIYLNGKKVLIHGGIRHRDYPWLGDAIPKWLTEMDVRDIAENLNFNFIRTAHYLSDKYFYDLTDRYGIIVEEELSGIKNQGSPVELQEQQIKELIRRDRNHPSIMIRSIGNETNNEAGSEYARKEDTTRILMASGVSGSFENTAKSSVGYFQNIVSGDLTDENGSSPSVGNLAGKSVTREKVTSGDPARIILKGSSQKIDADRGSVAIITADIVDTEGNHVNGATNTIKWSVTGPATLAGYSVYESYINRHNRIGGVWYADLPVSNVVRSAGTAGRITVLASAPGLASGSVTIEAIEMPADNSIISEPVLNDEGRRGVFRPEMSFQSPEESRGELKKILSEINLGKRSEQDYKAEISRIILKNNPSTDTTTTEYKTLVSLFTAHLVKNKGLLIADDYNFNTGHYNNCRIITGYINPLKLPPLFKDWLRGYYSEEIILKGNEKNAGDEMNWLNWIPSGGAVVVSQSGKDPVWPKGTIITTKTDLADLITAVHPVFAKYSSEAKERALIFIAKMNPYVIVTKTSEVKDGKKVTNFTYIAEKSKPILIPLIKFISE